jgi:hypothetical protein
MTKCTDIDISGMSNAQVLEAASRAADAWLEQELAASEALLADIGATAEEIDAAIGRNGFVRRMLQQDRDAQVAEIEHWLMGSNATRH